MQSAGTALMEGSRDPRFHGSSGAKHKEREKRGGTGTRSGAEAGASFRYSLSAVAFTRPGQTPVPQAHCATGSVLLSWQPSQVVPLKMATPSLGARWHQLTARSQSYQTGMGTSYWGTVEEMLDRNRGVCNLMDKEETVQMELEKY